jgi:hypothetical protein
MRKRKPNKIFVEPTGVAVPLPVFEFGRPLKFMTGPMEIDFNIDYWQDRLRSNEIRIVTSEEIEKRKNKKPKLTEVEKKLDVDFRKQRKKKDSGK